MNHSSGGHLPPEVTGEGEIDRGRPAVDGWSRPWFALAADGAVVSLRRLNGDDDADAYLAFHRGLSPSAVYHRFFTSGLPADSSLLRALDGDPSRDIALAVEVEGEIVAVANAIWEEGEQSSEIAFAVRDDHHHRGLGTLLLEALAVWGIEAGIGRFHALVLPENHAMLVLFRTAGFVFEERHDEDGVIVRFVLDARAMTAVEEREQEATAASLRPLLRPRARLVLVDEGDPLGVAEMFVAISGSTLGYPTPDESIPTTTLAVGPDGAVPGLAEVHGAPLDLAIVAVRPAKLADVIDRCGAHGVAAVVAVGPAPPDSEADVLDAARRHGMRLIGPSAQPPRRIVGDGEVGVCVDATSPNDGVIESLDTTGLAVGDVVDLGRRLDVSVNDVLQFWESESEVSIGIVAASPGNPGRFVRIARRFSERRSLVVLQPGAHDLPGLGPALPASADESVASLGASDPTEALRLSGAVRVASPAELAPTVVLLAGQPLPSGGVVAVIADHSELGHAAASACRAGGLVLPYIGRGEGRATADERASEPLATYPIMVDGAEWESAIRAAITDDGVDAVLLASSAPAGSTPELIEALDAVGSAHSEVTMCATFLSDEDTPVLTFDVAGSGLAAARRIPVFGDPIAAAQALTRAHRLTARRRAMARLAVGASSPGRDLDHRLPTDRHLPVGVPSAQSSGSSASG